MAVGVPVSAPAATVANWTLAVALSCTAPGYGPGTFVGGPVLSEGFDGGVIPPGWSVQAISGIDWRVYSAGDPCGAFEGNQTGGSYTDYIDPEDSGRKVRIITEKWSSSSARWAETAENGLKTRSTSCVKPYNQVSSSTETELASKPAAEFEYTCGEGDAMRHGVWRGVAQDGKAYSFYLTATDAKFAESKPIFDEMARTFQLTGNG